MDRLADELIATFDPVDLSETNRKAALLDRSDTKYAMTIDQLNEALEASRTSYRILEIQGSRSFRYETTYFDTPELRFYHEHHAGKQDRKKVRIRRYLDSGMAWLEVKHRLNKGNTVKTRVILDQHATENIGRLKDPEFIGTGSLPVDQLRPVIRISYERFTLVDLLNAERVTIDRHIVFQRGHETRTLDGLVIAEIKQHRKHPSFFRRQMRSKKIWEESISKYCLGTLLLNDQVKRNRFKAKLNRILKINDSLQQTIQHA
jgi:hypothetical protein